VLSLSLSLLSLPHPSSSPSHHQLLNKISTDIDIALNDMHGTAFAERAEAAFSAYQKAHPADATGGHMHHFNTIAANPDKSKHLETATVRIFDFSVDFVNLRAEDYAADSRIPAMRFGTPLQDALRRDLTINALFYNINEDKVEDFTGHGLRDLADGFIRTPLEPRTTFIDDPLRVMRAIRFGARFGYRYDDALVAAARLPDVKAALMSKVSRERIGQELYGIFAQAPQPLVALRTAADWNIFDVVFRSSLWTHARLEFGLSAGHRVTAAYDAVAPNAPHPPSLVVAALLSPLAGHKAIALKKPPPLVSFIVSDSLKWSNHDSASVQTTIDCALTFRPVLRDVDGFLASAPANWIDDVERVFDSSDVLGTTDSAAVQSLRRLRMLLGGVLRGAAELWRDSLCLAVALDELLGKGRPLLLNASGFSDLDLVDNVGAGTEPRTEQRFVDLQRYVQLITLLRLDGSWAVKPPLDGRQLQQMFQMPPGPWVSSYRERLVDRQLMFPGMTESDAATFMADHHAHATPTKKV
jgi:tRNA nucleotidyltransferase (CCA-adding enzyme)